MTYTDSQIEELVKLYGYHKVNLIYNDGAREGVWVVPETESDAKIYTDNKGKYKVVLCNDALGWANKKFGQVFIAETQGDYRSIAEEDWNIIEESHEK